MAATKDRLKADLVVALRAKDEATKTTIRMLLAAIGNEEVAGEVARELSDTEELATVTKELKRRQEAAQIYAEAGRPELAAKETSEAECISKYLPAPLTEAELQNLVSAELAALKDAGQEPTMRHMGALVKAVNVKASGRADGKTVASLVRAALNS